VQVSRYYFDLITGFGRTEGRVNNLETQVAWAF
jgi:hypothetical protein